MKPFNIAKNDDIVTLNHIIVNKILQRILENKTIFILFLLDKNT